MTQRPIEKFFGPEKHRNMDNAHLFERLLRKAWGETTIIVGHHVMYEFDDVLDTEDEIPSADTLLFNHGIMEAVFGQDGVPLMQRIAALKPYERETAVLAALDALEAAQ